MPRAGSTLLQNILAQNPDMHATPTSGLVHLVHTAKKGYTENVEFKGSDQYDWKKHFFKFVKGGMESLASSVDDKKYFTVVRNPIDRAFSYYKMSLRGKKQPYNYLAEKSLYHFAAYCPDVQNIFCKYRLV